jgi:hypothetical protein
MTLPGFSAKAALAPATGRYREGPAPGAPFWGAGLLPQQLNYFYPCRGTSRVCCTVDLQGDVSCHTVPCLMVSRSSNCFTQCAQRCHGNLLCLDNCAFQCDGA